MAQCKVCVKNCGKMSKKVIKSQKKRKKVKKQSAIDCEHSWACWTSEVFYTVITSDTYHFLELKIQCIRGRFVNFTWYMTAIRPINMSNSLLHTITSIFDLLMAHKCAKWQYFVTCTFIKFWKKFLPTRLLGTTRLLILWSFSYLHDYLDCTIIPH